MKSGYKNQNSWFISPIYMALAFSILMIFFSPCFSEANSETNRVDRVVVIKSKRVMLLLNNGEILKAYRIALGKSPTGHKTKEGDKKTPEGSYILSYKNPNSRFHRSILISYPNESDILNAQRLGISPGGYIAIHGLSKEAEKFGKFHVHLNWTDGCIAVTNSEIEEIWHLVSEGTSIEIRP